MKRMFQHLGLIVASVIAIVLLIEGLFRFFPLSLPAGVYTLSSYDEKNDRTQRTIIYNKVRYTERKDNRERFLDIDHGYEKPKGTVRIGFFGDSYVEALTVPLESTFFRRLPRTINDTRIEPLAFGRSGWGTYHALQSYRTFGDRYDLDIVFYVFTLNDPADQSYTFSKQLNRLGWPSLRLRAQGEGYDVVPAVRSPSSSSGFTVDVLSALQNVSMLAKVIRYRLRTLRNSRAADSAIGAGKIPSPQAPLDRWRPSLLTETKRLGAYVLADFANSVRADGREFYVLYVTPPGLIAEKPVAEDTQWFPWLRHTLIELEVPLLDPRERFRSYLMRDHQIYNDHWTPAGHKAVAEEITEFLEHRL